MPRKYSREKTVERGREKRRHGRTSPEKGERENMTGESVREKRGTGEIREWQEEKGIF